LIVDGEAKDFPDQFVLSQFLSILESDEKERDQ
jgi:hypothetical protein